MAAIQTVPQHLQRCNFDPILPRHGVVTLFGYGTSICVERGHLTIEDGIGKQRRYARFPRVGHGLKRLVVIGSDGLVSLTALRWLADQGAAFVMLDRDGKVLLTTGPVRPSDARLRRSQALAESTGAALQLTRELIAQKLSGQEKVARDKLKRLDIASCISSFRSQVDADKGTSTIRQCESLGAKAYWSAWRMVPVAFPRNDLRRIPSHWQVFGTRESPLTNSPRLAVNPANAILNYLYAILETEARLAAAALGLDPGLGVLHLDSRTRDSLACDLMEPVCPMVDAFLLDWLSKGPLKREWFFEERDGNCRLMGPFAQLIAETALNWRREVAPYAERAAHIFWASAKSKSAHLSPATRLTQSYRRMAKGKEPLPSGVKASESLRLCKLCGTHIMGRHKFCSECAPTNSKEALIVAARKGRIAAQTPQVLARLGEKQRSHRLAERDWNPAGQPDWLDDKAYTQKIHPHLADVTISTIALTLGVSLPYASDIRAGRRRPHPRHWLSLARLVGALPHS
ncbi:MAG: CRISPR-associated endonuclease Cas1 [Acidobacteria bacterium]|nr:MAG: CRISPR-associated endonuclease Cas1 [Acidobacteriota bacterium]